MPIICYGITNIFSGSGQTVPEPHDCGGTLQLGKIWKFVHVFFIPLLPIGRKDGTKCNQCGNKYVIHKIREEPYSRTVALVLWLVGFFGMFGLQKFYVGKKQLALLHLVTMGFFYVGAILDFILILTGKFKDQYGEYVTNW